MIRILIVDDHPVFRRGLSFLLSTAGHDVIGEAASGSEAIEAAETLRPDLVVLDLGLPELHGTHVAARLTAVHPDIRILVLTMYDDDQSVRRSLDAGVAGYILKDAPPEQILAAIDAAAQGARVIGSGIGLPTGSAPTRAPLNRYAFTTREHAVAELLVKGLRNRAIAERLGISEKTAANYVASVRLKVGAPTRYEAARLLREQ